MQPDDKVYYNYELEFPSYINVSRIFTWVDEEFCGEVTCEITMSGCLGTLSGDYLVMKKDEGSFIIDIKTDQEKGYVSDLCIKCNSKSQTITFSPFTIVQRPLAS
jgi:hypothetical protein